MKVRIIKLWFGCILWHINPCGLLCAKSSLFYIYIDQPINVVVECSLMAGETWVQSQFMSYQRLKKWYLIPPCLALSIIKYVSRVKWSNPEKGVVPSPTPQGSSYWKGSLLVALDYSHQLYFTYYFSYQFWLISNKVKEIIFFLE